MEFSSIYIIAKQKAKHIETYGKNARKTEANMSATREIITSRQNKTVSLISSLEAKKARDREELFRLDGVKLTCEAIKKGLDIYCIALLDSAADVVADKAKKLYGVDIFSLNTRLIFVNDSVFERLTDEKAPEGVVCAARYMKNMHRAIDDASLIPSEAGEENILLLESVRDPSNVGAIIRSAAAFNVDRIIMSSDCADIYNPKTLRASMGNMLSMKIDRVSDICAAIKRLQNLGVSVYAAALKSDSKKLGSGDFSGKSSVIIGNEGHGLSESVLDACDETVYIPMADGVESLNASVAAAILTWEFFGK